MNKITIEKTALEGLLILKPRLFSDARGFFYESYNQDAFKEAGIDVPFVQDNHSRSTRGTLRGLHFQTYPGQAKLVRCTQGTIWDVAVDIRPQSPTFGQYHAVELSPEEGRMFFIPVGFAHGFLVLSPIAEVQYKCSAVYNASTEAGIQWNDMEIGVPWPLMDLMPILSHRDQNAPSFSEIRKTLGR